MWGGRFAPLQFFVAPFLFFTAEQNMWRGQEGPESSAEIRSFLLSSFIWFVIVEARLVKDVNRHSSMDGRIRCKSFLGKLMFMKGEGKGRPPA